MDENVRVKINELESFVRDVLVKTGMNEKDAEISTDVMVCADKRGIKSHGVARLKRYLDHIKSGAIILDAEIKTVVETPVSLVIDGGGGMGQLVGHHAMSRCIEKAKTNFMCFAAIRNSNHYGIAGYYSLMALKENMIGLSLTNSAPLVVPTFGKDALLGTNPISLGVPAKEEKPYLLDMATSTVPRGKLEVEARKGDSIPSTWATDENGLPTTDAQRVLDNLSVRAGGGLLPMGGASMENGGHKGYGLASLVDIFCGVFSGGAVGSDVYGKKGQPPEVAHFLGVFNPDAFLGLGAIEDKMDYFSRMLKNSPLADNQDRIYVAGEVEFEAEDANRESVSVQKKVFNTLNEIGKEFGLKLEI
ncbi:MAG: Ldh family oxidoreductase [bacterium]|nr:Ldh family oxidoreductase [bacterium]